MKTKNIKVVYTYRHCQSGGILHSGTGPCTAVPKIQISFWIRGCPPFGGRPFIIQKII